jgi:hypothetical protein
LAAQTKALSNLLIYFSKSHVVSIRCNNIDLDNVLQGIPATCATFPLQYLGLPLSVWCLRRRDFQSLEDKCSGRLTTWNGKLVPNIEVASLACLLVLVVFASNSLVIHGTWSENGWHRELAL